MTCADGNYHIVPMDDLREHILRIDCPCHPQPDEEEPLIIVHNSFDGREAYETGERKEH